MHTIAVPVPPPGGFTLKDLADVYTHRRTQLIHGGLYVNAAPAAWHNLVAHKLTDVIQEAAGDDVIVIPGLAVELAENHAPEPDIVAVARSAYSPDANSFLPGQVPLVVEIVSRDKRKDRIVRPEEYARAGTEHFGGSNGPRRASWSATCTSWTR